MPRASKLSRTTLQLCLAVVMGLLLVECHAADPKPKPKAGAKAMIEPKTSIPVWADAKAVPYNNRTLEPYPSGPAAALDPTASLPASIKLTGIEASDVSTGLIVNSKCHRALVSWLRPARTGSPSTRLVLCDLQESKVLGSVLVPTAAVPMALSDGGELIAVRMLPEAGAEQEYHMEVWTWGDKVVSREMRFTAHTDSQKYKESFTHAAFLGEDRLATLSTVKQLIFWEWRTPKALVRFDVYDPTMTISLSDDRKTLFASTNNCEPTGINTETYSRCGYTSYSSHLGNDVRLCATGDRILVNTVRLKDQDLKNYVVNVPGFKAQPPFVLEQVGRLLAFPCPEFAIYESEAATTGPGKKPPKPAANRREMTASVRRLDEDSHLERVDPTYVTSGAVTVFDLQNQVRAWEYTNIDRLACDRETWCLTLGDKGKDVALVPLVVPVAELTEKMAKAVAEPDYFILGEGSVIKLNLKGIPAGDRDEAASIIEKKLAEHNKWTVGTNGDAELVAKVGEPYMATHNVIEPPSLNPKQVQEKQFTVDITILYKGKPVYSAPTRSRSLDVDRPKGESFAAFYARHQGTPLLALKSLYIPPRKRYGPEGNKPLGSTKVTPKYSTSQD